MTESLLIQVREKQAEATREVLDRYRKSRLPKLKRDRERLARELSQLIAEHPSRFADDGKLLRSLIHEAQDRSPEEVDRINEFLQRYLGLVISLCGLFRGMALKLTEAGYRVKGVKSVDAMIAEREEWRENLPEQLALVSRPIRSTFRERVAHALGGLPQETDWRSLLK